MQLKKNLLILLIASSLLSSNVKADIIFRKPCLFSDDIAHPGFIRRQSFHNAWPCGRHLTPGILCADCRHYVSAERGTGLHQHGYHSLSGAVLYVQRGAVGGQAAADPV